MWSFGSKKEGSQGKTSDGSAASSDPGSDHHNRQLSPKGGGRLTSKKIFSKNKKLSSSTHDREPTSKSKSPSGMAPRTPQQGIRKNRVLRGESKNRRKSTPANDEDFLQDFNVNDTSDGIEVSYPGIEGNAPTPGSKGKGARIYAPIISLKEQILVRQRVFKSQFSTQLSASNNDAYSAANTKKWKPKRHRIPLLGITPAAADYASALQLLKTTPLIDERTAVEKELKFMEAEISNLEQDRIWLEQSVQSTSFNSGKPYAGSDSNKENAMVTWDAHTLLKNDATKKQPLPISERTALQKQRGNCLTIHLSNNRTQERFVLAFGGKQNLRTTHLFRSDESIITLAPTSSSSTTSGATTLQYINLISSTNKAASNGGLYFSQDLGKSQTIGHLPSKICQRLGDNELDVADLAYLSTGSRGCYFTKFQSGESWWGSAIRDADFYNILNSWDVYRVAFGPMKTIENSQLEQAPGKPSKLHTTATLVNSWIVLSHDGKAAWKNLPSRLSKKLELYSAAPVEVSLGIGDSYFVRFLDGTIDYSLPSKIARVCERIEERGGKITNISLHPDISNDFVVRHTELAR
eukprot:CAMPEP_0116102152 /NCGR_PEP_ID=MMETSP0327-20121206/13193_1 /TAXON_ID=44447 /ORGANISM="Pseudo-nitzschia delicatissima, Strain B596" /LENGTH=577 /DNA_ID=CAMNT_0003594165 /DNA_START=99 /DNA_END=1835 /DNA_ORIENTATION=-